MTSRPMSNIDKRATELLIENGVLVADTLRHLADNEIDSDYFAICHTNENGTEIECELAITDYARQAAGVVDELVKALEAAEKRITELEATVSEPVAFRSKLKASSAAGCEHWDYTDHRQPDAFELENCVIERLFIAPPAPVSVMDEAQSRELFEKNCMANIERNKWHPDLYAHLPAREQWAAWEACRNAMLQGADGNSPVIPDGWVAVPVEPTTNQWAAGMQAFDSGMDKVTRVYKAMLAAAPQQDL